MTRAEAGRKGGLTTKQRHGDEFFGRILSDEVLHATVLRSVLGREVVPTFRLIEN